MDSRTAAERAPSPEAIEFVRFCYRRRRVGWPELYDEMCAVAGRGLFRGWGSDELSAEGIGFSLFELAALAELVGRVVAEDHERHGRPTAAQVRAAMAATVEADASPASEGVTGAVATPGVTGAVATPGVPIAATAPGAPTDQSGSPDLHFAQVPAGA
jgi:uncharacterized protein (DUF885 family)